MSQPTRKRQHQQQSPPVVKEEQQEQEEDTHSNSAAINGNASQCSSSNCANSNTTGTAAAGGNANCGDGDDMNEMKLKMAALEAKNQILEGKLANQELNARIHAMNEEDILANLKQENRALWMRLKKMEETAQIQNNKMMDEFGQKLAALETKYQQEIAKLSAEIKVAKGNQQKQLATANCHSPDSDCVVVDMDIEESAVLIPPPPIAPNLYLMPSHSADLPDCVVNMPESSHSHAHGNVNTLDEQLSALKSRHRQQTTVDLIPPPSPPPPKAVAQNPVPRHSAQQEMVEAKRCNPLGNGWNPHTCRATMKITMPDQLSVYNSSPVEWGNIIARKGFPVSVSACRQVPQNHFAGPIIYYYEIKIKSSKHNESRLSIGFSHGTVPKGSWIGRLANTYAMQDNKRDYCLLSGKEHFFEWPAGAIKPKWYGYGCRDVYGCGLVLSADNKLAIFFTTNGILMGKQIAIHHLGSILFPCLQLNRDVTVEANFGQKPFNYNIDECPGLQLRW